MSIELAENQANAHTAANRLIIGELEKDVAGGSNVTLSDVEAQYHRLVFTGLLTANIDVIVPSEDKSWWIQNATTGAFTLTVKQSGGTGVAVTQGNKVCLGYSTYAGDVVAWTAEL